MIINSLIFSGSILVFITLMLIYTWFKIGKPNWAGFKDYFFGKNGSESSGSGAIIGIVLAALIPFLLGVILSALSIGIAKASEVKYLTETNIFAGLEETEKLSPMCYADGADNRITSSLGVWQQLIGYHDVDLFASYQHHSCAVNRDNKSYDAFGLKVNWKIKWK